jgi:hypothetical protein
MTQRSRLARLEATLPEPPAPDEWHSAWLWFRDFAFAVLEEGGHAEALALARVRVAGNEPHVFPGDGPILRSGGADVRLWVMTQTVWTAVLGFPQAREALEAALRLVEAARREGREIGRKLGPNHEGQRPIAPGPAGGSGRHP